ncbi:B- and T-lymphocyte attenuator isoform 1-T1 [Fundulus diaphanus]
MKPALHWTALSWSIWAVLFFTSKANDEECTTELQVRRNTVYETLPGKELRIDCPVVFCNNSPPTINWHKIEDKRVHLNDDNNHIITGWETSGLSRGIFYLIFKNIVSNDSGIYRCEGGGSVSHNINIAVNGATEARNNTHTTITNDITEDPHESQTTNTFLMYVYCAAGIGSFVIIVVILSVICMQGCKRKSKKDKGTENQYMEIPLAEQSAPNATGLQHSPRGNSNPLPSRRTSERKTTAPPPEPRISRDNVQLYGQVVQDRKRLRNATQAGEANSNVVYASLNHGPAPREVTRPHRQMEETEYAAIRLT